MRARGLAVLVVTLLGSEEVAGLTSPFWHGSPGTSPPAGLIHGCPYTCYNALMLVA